MRPIKVPLNPINLAVARLVGGDECRLGGDGVQLNFDVSR
jgi:hypothetical protein